MIKYISGASSYTYSPNVLGRDFHILGDIHLRQEDKCPENIDQTLDIVDYLDYNFRASDNKKIDFFVELPYQGKDVMLDNDFISIQLDLLKRVGEPPPDEVLIRIENRFKECFTREKKSTCRELYPNVHFHYVDYRTHKIGNLKVQSFFTNYAHDLVKIIKNLTNFKGRIRSTYFNHIKPLTLIIGGDEYKQIITDYIHLAHFTWYQRYISPALELAKISGNIGWESISDKYENRIKKQLISINPIIRIALDKYFEDTLNEFNDDYILISKSLEMAYLKSNYTNIIALLKRKLFLLIETNAIFMNMYMLARIFKQSYNDSQEVWVYAGNAHCNEVRNFINLYLGNQIEYEANVVKILTSSGNIEYKKCLNISEIILARSKM